MDRTNCQWLVWLKWQRTMTSRRAILFEVHQSRKVVTRAPHGKGRHSTIPIRRAIRLPAKGKWISSHSLRIRRERLDVLFYRPHSLWWPCCCSLPACRGACVAITLCMKASYFLGWSVWDYIDVIIQKWASISHQISGELQSEGEFCGEFLVYRFVQIVLISDTAKKKESIQEKSSKLISVTFKLIWGIILFKFLSKSILKHQYQRLWRRFASRGIEYWNSLWKHSLVY